LVTYGSSTNYFQSSLSAGQSEQSTRRHQEQPETSRASRRGSNTYWDGSLARHERTDPVYGNSARVSARPSAKTPVTTGFVDDRPVFHQVEHGVKMYKLNGLCYSEEAMIKAGWSRYL